MEASPPPDEKNTQEENEKVKEKPKEPLNFLHVAEQEKVRKMISQYQKLEEAEVGVQTNILVKVMKEVGLQNDGNKELTTKADGFGKTSISRQILL